jgi:hypothetical protein
MNKNKMEEIYFFLWMVGDLNIMDWTDSGSCLMLWD